jgi:unsaturated rhamnogalacturonyl hydrolase
MLKNGILFFVVLLVGTSVQAQPERAADASEPWSVRMAESVMERRPLVRERWDYETGTVLRGIEELWQATGEERYYDYIKQNVDAYVGPDGTIRTYDIEDYNLDNINTGKLLFPLYERTGDERYRIAGETLHEQLEGQPTTSEGGYWHKQRYPYQMWLDGLYMAEPFAARYALEWGDPEDRSEALDHVALQYELAARYLRDPATGLFYHGWDEAKEQIWADSLTGRSANFWGRAMGWYAMALVDVLDYFPEDHPEHDEIVRILQRYAEAVSAVQDPVTGVWYQILDQPNREGNYLEASASSMFVYALAKGVRKGYLNPKYMDVARRGYEGLLEQFVTVEDGLVNLNRVVSVGGLGGDNDRDGSFAYYLSEPVISNDPKGTGPFILASLEMEMLADGTSSTP